MNLFTVPSGFKIKYSPVAANNPINIAFGAKIGSLIEDHNAEKSGETARQQFLDTFLTRPLLTARKQTLTGQDFLELINQLSNRKLTPAEIMKSKLGFLGAGSVISLGLLLIHPGMAICGLLGTLILAPFSSSSTLRDGPVLKKTIQDILSDEFNDNRAIVAETLKQLTDHGILVEKKELFEHKELYYLTELGTRVLNQAGASPVSQNK